MTKFLPIWLLAGLTFLHNESALANSPTTVILENHQLMLQYNQAVRLDRILLDAQNQDNLVQGLNTYHEGFRLFASDKDQQARTLLTKVKKQLNTLLHDENYHRAAKQLLAQLSLYQYGYREILNLDLDATRIKPELNPILAGQYRLQLTQRPDSIVLFGLSEQQKIKFKADYTIADYIQNSRASHKKHHSYAWLISPEGNVTRVGYAYWNDESTHIKPGSALLVGFGSNDKEIIQLEQEIATLISMIEGSTL
ncbi:capsule biosynthesis GfcC family protein [Vibrio fluvialis]|uniref:capsule biosynthesis GfcC family protein n=1 Tax=Vibrio fluvialis TaxID=676 RepID=UPI001EECD9E7|nr:capsule biosynthesis GfcC family protein [Vibrio fluvialis]MCG6401449.1 capsule biosynthesis GfcC family protein [Vibrio fluvialis]